MNSLQGHTTSGTRYKRDVLSPVKVPRLSLQFSLVRAVIMCVVDLSVHNSFRFALHMCLCVGMDLLGCLIVATITSVGGGTVRDLLIGIACRGRRVSWVGYGTR